MTRENRHEPVRTTRHLYLQATITAVFGEEPWWYHEGDAEAMHPYAYAMEVGLVPVTFTRRCAECQRNMWPMGKLTSEFARTTGQGAQLMAAAEWNDGLCSACVGEMYNAARITAFRTWRAWRMGGEA